VASGKFYGTAATSINLGTFTQPVDKNTCSNFRFLIPSDTTITRFLGAGTPMTIDTHYEITD
jgi:hypothetical protein